MNGAKQKLHEYTNASGFSYVSLTESWLAWRKHFGRFEFLKKRIPLDGGMCALCGGEQEYINPVYGMVRCLCAIKRVEADLQLLNRFRSGVIPKDIKEIEVWGSRASEGNIEKMLDAAERFAEWPKKWMTLSGKPGTGKTHILQWLADQFGPWALYITSTDFENTIFSSLDDGTLNEFILALKTIPVLLFDDLGMGFRTDIVLGKLEGIFDFRYNMYQEYPTAVTTNKRQDQLILYDMRIADRIRDVDRVDIVDLQEVKSWRTER
jgi:DNA replication protein DnaC